MDKTLIDPRVSSNSRTILVSFEPSIPRCATSKHRVAGRSMQIFVHKANKITGSIPN